LSSAWRFAKARLKKRKIENARSQNEGVTTTAAAPASTRTV
jgi:hypothetical protein